MMRWSKVMMRLSGFFEVLSRFSADEAEQERLEYFGSEEASQNDDFQARLKLVWPAYST